MNGSQRPVQSLQHPGGVGKGEYNQVYLQQFSVEYEYPVVFTDGLFDVENPIFAATLSRREPERRHRFIVYIDSNVATSWPGLIEQILTYADAHSRVIELVAPPQLMPGGEEAKNSPELVAQVLRALHSLSIDRQSFLVAIGGGAFLDLLGYVAATTHRGLRHIRVPTTVLAQNDSGVGVKNGINAFGVKNFIGCFTPPFAVLNDMAFLRTLSQRDRISGLAEAVKVALIRDATFFAWLEDHALLLRQGDRTTTAQMIRRCAELHLRQIAFGGDPFEAGNVRPLDYGHWAAHKLEALSQHDLRHGEAVAIGLALDTRYSVQVGLLPLGDEERVVNVLHTLGFSLWHEALELRTETGAWKLLDGLKEFQEHMGGELTITLLREIGSGEEVHQMEPEEILLALAWLRQREPRP